LLALEVHFTYCRAIAHGLGPRAKLHAYYYSLLAYSIFTLLPTALINWGSNKTFTAADLRPYFHREGGRKRTAHLNLLGESFIAVASSSSSSYYSC
jgi:hypothetical protein